MRSNSCSFQVTRTIDQQGRRLSLALDRVYEVLGIEADWYRILNDQRDPVLFDPDCFAVTESEEPTFWVRETDEDGKLYAYPRVDRTRLL